MGETSRSNAPSEAGDVVEGKKVRKKTRKTTQRGAKGKQERKPQGKGWNAGTKLTWFRTTQYRPLARQWKGYVVQHGPYAPYDSLERYLVSESVCEADRERAAKNVYIKDTRQAIKYGRMKLRPDWEQVRDGLLWYALCVKYVASEEAREVLLGTYPQYLEIVDTTGGAHEQYYGVCQCELCNGAGQNQHGKYLIAIRNKILNGEL